MKDLICSAIEKRKLIRLKYEFEPSDRIVEPHLLGRKQNGKDTLSAWQVRGYSNSHQIPSWKNFTLNKMQTLKVLDNETFTGARPGYNRNDSTMVHIYCRL